MNIPIKKLEAQFSISKCNFKLWFDPGVGGDVGRCRGVHFFFHTKEKDVHKDTPHVHCKYGSEELRINLNTLEIMDKPFKNNHNNKLAIKGVKLNQSELLRYWNRTVMKGESVKFKMYLPF